MDVFDLSARLSLDTSEYTGGLSDASTSSSEFGSKIAGGFATAMKTGAAVVGALATAVGVVSAKMLSSIQDVAAAGDEIDKQSQRVGMSAKAYQEWDHVMQLAGSSMAESAAGFKTLSNKVDEAINGSESAVNAFKALGYSMDEIEEMSREEAFEAVIYGLQTMEDSAERAALANDLLGRAGQNLTPLFNMTTEETQNLMQQFEDLGGVMGDDAVKASARYQDSLTILKSALSGTKNNIIGEFLPAAADVVDGLTAIFSGDSNKGLGTIKKGLASFRKSIADAMPKVVEMVSTLLPTIVEAVAEGLPMLLDLATEIVFQIADGIVANLPMLVETAINLVSKLVDGIIGNIDKIINAAFEIIDVLVSSLIGDGNITKMIDAAFTIIQKLAQAFMENVPIIIQSAIQIINELVMTLTDPNSLNMLIDTAIELLMTIAEGLVEAIPQLVDAAILLINRLVEFILEPDNLVKIIQAAIKIVVTLAKGLLDAVPKILTAAMELIGKVIDKFKETDWKSIGKNIVDGILNGLKAAWNYLTSWISDGISAIVGGVKNILGIHSPSKVFAEIGGFMAEGLGDGWNDEIDSVKNGISADMDFSAVPATASVNVVGGTGSTNDSVSLTEAIKNALDGYEIKWDDRNLGRLVRAYA